MFPSRNEQTNTHYEEFGDVLICGGDDIRDYVTCHLLLSAGDERTELFVEPSIVFTGTFIHPNFLFFILHFRVEGIEPVSVLRSLVGTHLFTTECFGIAQVEYDAETGSCAVMYAHRDVDHEQLHNGT